MSSRSNTRSVVGEPTWGIAHWFPIQGDWSVDAYLVLDSNRLVELSEDVAKSTILSGFGVPVLDVFVRL
ncbi:MAG: hypothetical protein R3E01_09325 [Pirellulaceae bacterium]|nr:hypothetical protein [Planctomycetales bacterium]